MDDRDAKAILLKLEEIQESIRRLKNEVDSLPIRLVAKAVVRC
jgi:hypothetical protein